MRFNLVQRRISKAPFTPPKKFGTARMKKVRVPKKLVQHGYILLCKLLCPAGMSLKALTTIVHMVLVSYQRQFLFYCLSNKSFK